MLPEWLKGRRGRKRPICRNWPLRIYPSKEITSLHLVKHNCISQGFPHKKTNITYIYKRFTLFIIKGFVIRYLLTQVWSLRSPTMCRLQARDPGRLGCSSETWEPEIVVCRLQPRIRRAKHRGSISQPKQSGRESAFNLPPSFPSIQALTRSDEAHLHH